MWKNTITKATNIKSKCEIIIGFLRQKWLRERTSVLLLSVNCLSCWEWTDILFPVTLGFRPQPDRFITLSVALTAGFSEHRSFLWTLYRWMNRLRRFERSQCFRPRILLKINLPESFEKSRATAETTQQLTPEYVKFEVDPHEPWS